MISKKFKIKTVAITVGFALLLLVLVDYIGLSVGQSGGMPPKQRERVLELIEKDEWQKQDSIIKEAEKP